MRIDTEMLEYRKQLGKRLRTIRLEKELKQEDISKLFVISKGSVSEYENGKNEPPLSFLLNFAQKFGVDIAWLLQGRMQPQPYPETEPVDLVLIQDQSTKVYGKEEEKILTEVINQLKKDKELLEIVWHIIKAIKGISKVARGE